MDEGITRPCGNYVGQVQLLLALADEAAGAASDADECGILLGVMRDCAYKIRREALRQSEMQRTTEPRLR